MLSIEDLNKKTDNEIVELVLENSGYFLHIVERYKFKLFVYIRRISNMSAEDAEDILQDVFIKVYQNLNDFDNDLKFSSWIYRITHNTVIDNFRKLKARPQIFDLDMDDDRIKVLANEFDIEKEIDEKQFKEVLNKVLSKLDVKFKEVIILKFLEEKDYKEISDIIKIPQGTVASRISKAKKLLKKELENIEI
ncbi:sigma-70 family RNA polymerase sigma factor [Candidatus Parcubacteria bacterium]|nr:sigma-70 family RNA polymerase sigma factor [Candidatus Parcubacteria bacterium]